MKNSFKFLAAFAVLFSLAFAIPKTATDPFIVVIDAGHGGKDVGASYDSYTEKEIVASISDKIKKCTTDKEVIIHFVRKQDEFIGLNERVNAINKLNPSLVLSLHLNYEKTGKAYGMEFFANEKANYHAVALENKFVNEKGYKSRGIKDAPFYMLKKVDAPAINFELGFLSNESDRAYLTNKDKQEEIAKAITEYINELK
jgi:N-acetylmuramoyl-L-alanine amidase